LTQHPLEIFELFLSEQTVALNTLKPEHDNKQVTIGGAVTATREIMTKNGQKMAFVKLMDLTAEIEIILFPSAYQQTSGLWELDKVVLIRGKVNTRDREGNQGEEIKVMVDDAREITSQQANAYQLTGKKPKTLKSAKTGYVSVSKSSDGGKSVPSGNERLYIRLSNSNDEAKLISLKHTIDTHKGDTEVVLVLGDAKTRQAIKLPGGIDRQSEGLSKLQQLVGADNVKIQ
jgi:DNA polymerase III alpha subunit